MHLLCIDSIPQSEFFHEQRDMLRRVFTPDEELSSTALGDKGEESGADLEEEGASSHANNSTPPYSPLPEFEDLESC